nr:MAG TPA: hypothetical protein [Caudoviricetes sp.]
MLLPEQPYLGYTCTLTERFVRGALYIGFSWPLYPLMLGFA